MKLLYLFFIPVLTIAFTSQKCKGQSLVSKIAGGGSTLGDGGPATAAQVSGTQGVYYDAWGNLYIMDVGHARVRKIDPNGIIHTVAGNGTTGYSGDNGPATAAKIDAYGLSSDAAGNMYIGDWGNNRVRRVDAVTGIITTVAGNGMGSSSGDGGPATAAQISEPIYACVDYLNNMYISEYGSNKIRKVDGVTGIITTLATGVSLPCQLAVDAQGNVYVAAQVGYIKKVTASGIVTTFAGGGTGTASGVPATSTSLAGPEGVTIDCAGNVLIADNDHQLIREVNASTGIITTIAGTGSSANNITYTGVPALSANFHNEMICFDPMGNVYCTDDQDNYVYKISNVLNSTPISITGGSVCIGSTLQLTSSPSGGSWSSSDTTIAKVASTTGIVTGAAIGTVTVIYTAPGGCFASATVIVGNSLSLNVTHDTTICGSHSIQLNASGADSAYTWSPATGLNNANISDPIAQVNSTTTYTVTGIDSGGCSGSDPVTITIHLGSTSVTISGNLSICSGQNDQLNASGADSAYIWTPVTGLNNAHISDPIANINTTTTYVVTGIDSGGCASSDSIKITVQPSLTIAITGNSSTCTGQYDQLHASGADSAYIWVPATGLNYTTINDPIASAVTSITYTVTGIDSGGCTGTSSFAISVHPYPVIRVTGDTSECIGQNDQLNATGADSAYIWVPATGLNNANISNPIANVNSTTTYTVSGIDSGGCSENSSFTINTNGHIAPVITITGNQYVCYGQYDQLYANGAVTYSWLPPDYITNSDIANPLVHPMVATTYIVMGTDNNGCVGEDSIHIDVKPLPVLSVSSSGTVTCSDTTVQLSASGAASYVWSPVQYILYNNSHSADPFVSPSGNTMFWVTGTDYNGCSNTDSILVASDKSATVFVPSAFTPNNDGLNDVIYPKMYCDFILDQFSIYDRWGKMVFTTKIEDEGWDGTFHGVPQPIGSFDYFIKGHKKSDGKAVFSKGSFTLIR